jgi:hypothetical protein
MIQPAKKHPKPGAASDACEREHFKIMGADWQLARKKSQAESTA